MVPRIAPPSLFFNIDLFSCTQHFATFYISLYDIYTMYNKYNQTVVSIYTRFLTCILLYTYVRNPVWIESTV